MKADFQTAKSSPKKGRGKKIRVFFFLHLMVQKYQGNCMIFKNSKNVIMSC